MSDSDALKCRVKAMDLLSRREHSERELAEKLHQRDFEPALVAQVLADLVAERLLSNERFAESYIRSKRHKGVGPLRLRQALREHQIEVGVIGQALAEYDWLDVAAEVREKRFGAAIPQEYKDKARQMRFLQYRGFSLDQINRVMKSE